MCCIQLHHLILVSQPLIPRIYDFMPPKFDPNDPEVAKLIDLFQTIGFTKPKATETAKSAKHASALKDIIEKNGLSSKGVDDKKASLIHSLAVQGAKLGDPEQAYIVDAVVDGRLKSSEQVSGACSVILVVISSLICS